MVFGEKKDSLGAIELTQQARQLLKYGKIEEAKAKFAQARELDANVAFGENEINTIGAIELTQQARQLLKEGKKEQAKAKFAQAKKWDKNVVFGDEEFEPD